jgi:hypothetical protein
MMSSHDGKDDHTEKPASSPSLPVPRKRDREHGAGQNVNRRCTIASATGMGPAAVGNQRHRPAVWPPKISATIGGRREGDDEPCRRS